MDTPCFWCRRRQAEEFVDFAMQAYARRNTTVLEVLKGAQPIAWRSSSVPIPICRTCVRAHQEATAIRDRWGYLYAAGGSFALLVLGLVVFGMMQVHFPGSFAIWWAVVIAWVVAAVKTGRDKALRRLQESGTARYRDGQTYPAVVDMQARGWKAGSPGTFDRRIARFEYF